jgi:hypothetical protein
MGAMGVLMHSLDFRIHYERKVLANNYCFDRLIKNKYIYL